MKRINEIMFLRVAAMIFVVLYHCYCFYGIWKYPSIYNFGNLPDGTIATAEIYTHISKIINNFTLPTFFFLSGVLYFRSSSKVSETEGNGRLYVNFLKKKCTRLLLPYIAWRSLHYAIPVIPAEAYGHLWFLITLWWMFMIVEPIRFFCKKTINTRIRLVSLLLLIIISSIIPLPHYHHFPIDTIIHYLPFFLCGSIWNENLRQKYNAKMYFGLGIIIFMLTYYNIDILWLYRAVIQIAVTLIIMSLLNMASKFTPPI